MDQFYTVDSLHCFIFLFLATLQKINAKRKMIGFMVLSLAIFTKDEVTCGGCVKKKFNHDSFVCVCNGSYCDTWGKVEAPKSGSYNVWTTSRDGARAQKSTGKFAQQKKSGKSKGAWCTIDSSKTYQKVNGFGGAITDSAGIHITSLSSQTRDYLMRSYFTTDGLEYTRCRVPIGGTDFSTRPYTYADNDTDHSLESFALQPEDTDYKIPLIHQAENLTQGLKLYATMWSPPAWMKTNNNLTGLGLLKPEFRQLLADYHKRFLDAYKEYGLNFDCISTGNEPMMGLSPWNRLNALGTAPNLQAEWIAENLGPTIHSEFPNTCILIGDDQRITLPWWPRTIMDNKDASQYVAGIAVHWYFDVLVSPSYLDETHDFYPELPIINTEASIIPTPEDPEPVALGSWSRAETYASGIIQDFRHWVTGWMDWNIALDQTGGPNWIDNYVDSPIIVNKEKDEFYKQPMFYIIGHFSKFLTNDSQIINSSCSDSALEILAGKRIDGGKVVTVLNKDEKNKKITLSDGNLATQMNVPKKSMLTILYRSEC